MAVDPLDIDKTLEKPPDKHGDYTLAPGDTLGQYKIVRTLGRGGMGEVDLCEHAILTTRHAVKLLPAERSTSAGFVALLIGLGVGGFFLYANRDSGPPPPPPRGSGFRVGEIQRFNGSRLRERARLGRLGVTP